jgi:outer membrane protein OmpA-like peptidoglycan-associated protein
MRHTHPAGGVRLSLFATLLLAATLLAGPSALAQPASLARFELERLSLNTNGQGSLVVGTGELLPSGGFRLSLLAHYENDPLVMYRDGVRLGSVVEHRYMGHLLAAWAPIRWLELGAQLPVVLWQTGDDLSGQGVASPARTGLGTPFVYARLGLLAQAREAPVDLALELGTGLPVGSAEALSRDSLVRIEPKVMVGRRFGWLRAGLEGGVLVRPAVVLGDGTQVQDELGNEVRLGAALATTGTGLRGELNARGTLPLSREGKTLELLAGLRLPLGETVEAYALGGPGFGDAPGTPTFRLLLGLALTHGKKPPEVVLDDDHDGVRNEEDACPTVPGPAERKGCPRDTDGDGIEDGADKCPTEAGPTERQGCPVRDSDKDGIEDGADKCPTEAGLQELRGCPAKDGDGDSVADHLDNCPAEAGVASNQGCPEKQKQLVAIQTGKLNIKEQVFFATGKAIIQPRSFKLLDQVAGILREHPELELLRIEGHTDNVGKPAANLKLSKDRAAAVRDYLITKGVAPERLEAEGFGQERPIASNTTAKGRAANRRVDFLTVTRQGNQP